MERHGDCYRNTPEASLFLDPAKSTYIGQWLAIAGAAMRDLADPTIHLWEVSANGKAHPPLADQMWADIANVLRGARAQDEA